MRSSTLLFSNILQIQTASSEFRKSNKKYISNNKRIQTGYSGKANPFWPDIFQIIACQKVSNIIVSMTFKIFIVSSTYSAQFNATYSLWWCKHHHNNYFFFTFFHIFSIFLLQGKTRIKQLYTKLLLFQIALTLDILDFLQ